MKLFAVAALACLVAISIIVLSSCSSEPTKPTPFITGEEVRPVGGCLALRKQVEEWNKKNPASPKKADC